MHSPDDTLTLDFWPPELWENKCLLFKLPSCDTVMAAPGNEHAGSPLSHDSNSVPRDMWDEGIAGIVNDSRC